MPNKALQPTPSSDAAVLFRLPICIENHLSQEFGRLIGVAELGVRSFMKPHPWIWLALLALIAAGVTFAFYLTSPRRDAEVALGLKWLPWSTRNLITNTDAWTDYVVRGYIEISPSDFERIVRARKYERDNHPRWKLNEEPLPLGKPLTATTTYRWGDGSAHANLSADDSHSWIWFTYSTD